MFTALLSVPCKLKLFLFLSPAGANKKLLNPWPEPMEISFSFRKPSQDHNLTFDPLDVLSKLSDSLR